MNVYVRAVTSVGVATVALVVSITGSVAIAQTSITVAEGEGTLAEIVVTAQRREQNLQNVPVALSVFTGELMEELGATSIIDLNEYAPNVVITPGSVNETPSATVTIRGVGQLRPEISSEVPVAIYVDDVYWSQMDGAMLNAMDVERVEILRGPQGTLFGRNATGGAIAFHSRDPEFNTNSGNVKLTGGDYSRADVGATFNWGSERVALRANVLREDREGYITRLVDGDTVGGHDNLLGRLKLAIAPNDRFNMLFTADSSDQKTNGAARHILDLASGGERMPGLPPPFWVHPTTIAGNPQSFGPFIIDTIFYNAGPPSMGVGPSLRGNGPYWNAENAGSILTGDRFIQEGGDPGVGNIQSSGVSAEFNVELSDSLAFKAIAATRSTETLSVDDADGSTRFNLRQSESTSDLEYASQEFQLISSQERFDWVAGLYFFQEEASQISMDTGQTAFGEPGNVDISDDNSDVNTTRAFFQGTWALTDRLNLTAGVGWTGDEKMFTVGSFSPSEAFDVDQTWDGIQPKLALDYAVSTTVMVYGSLSQGWRSGGFNTLDLDPDDTDLCQAIADLEGVALMDPDNACVEVNFGNRAYQEEALDSFEIGARMELLDRRLRLNVTYFDSDYHNIQVTNVDIGRPYTVSAGESTISGLEVEGLLQATENLQIQYSLGLQNAPRGDDDDREVLTNTPQQSGSLGLNYGRDTNAGARLTGHISYGWQGETLGAGLVQRSRDAYGVVRARLTYLFPGERWEASLFCTNCTDQVYDTGHLDFASRNFPPISQFVVVGRPREWGAEFIYNFGDL